jgi:hypothetical protein
MNKRLTSIENERSNSSNDIAWLMRNVNQLNAVTEAKFDTMVTQDGLRETIEETQKKLLDQL